MQLIIMVPVIKMIRDANITLEKETPWSVYIRIVGIIVTQLVGFLPIMIAELMSIFRLPIHAPHIRALAACIPIAHVMDALLIGSRLYLDLDTTTFQKVKNNDPLAFQSNSRTDSEVSDVKETDGAEKEKKDEEKKEGMRYGQEVTFRTENGGTAIIRRIRKAKKSKSKTEQADVTSFDSKLFIRNVSVILLSPLVGLAVVGAMSIQRYGYDSNFGKDVVSTIDLNKAISQFIHWTQQERGYSQVYMEADNITKTIVDTLTIGKWGQTDSSIPALLNAFGNFTYEEVMDLDCFIQGYEYVGNIEYARDMTFNFKWSAADSFNWYTTMNANLAETQMQITLSFRQDSVDYALLAFYAFMTWMESVSRELQLAEIAVTAGQFEDDAAYSLFVQACLTTDEYYHIFYTFAEPETIAFVDAQPQEHILKKKEYRDILLDNDPDAIANLTLHLIDHEYEYVLYLAVKAEKQQMDWIVHFAHEHMVSQAATIALLMTGFVVLTCWTCSLVFSVVFASTAPKQILDYLARDVFGRQLTFPYQVVMTLMIPFGVTFALYISCLSSSLVYVQYYSKLDVDVLLMKRVSDLILQIDLERPVAIQYFNEQIMTDDTEKLYLYQEQIHETDVVRQDFYNYVDAVHNELTESDVWGTMMEAQSQMNLLRMRVWSMTTIETVQEVINMYNDMLQVHLDVYGELIRQSRPDNFVYDLLSYTLYLPAKEKSGAERARGVAPYNAGSWDDYVQFQGWAYYAISQQPWFEMALVYFQEKEIEFEEAIMDDERVDNWFLWKYDLLSMDPEKIQSWGIDGAIWFGEATYRIDLMLQVAEFLDEQLIMKASIFESDTSKWFLVVSALTMSSFVFSDAFTTLIMWRLVKLKELARQMRYSNFHKRRQG